MADFSRMKRRSSLGEPPPITEASSNLEAPEAAPAAPPPITTTAPATREQPPERRAGDGRPDGRSARRTGRTVQFATRVSLEFDERLRTLAARDGLMLVEVLERALDAYDQTRS